MSASDALARAAGLVDLPGEATFHVEGAAARDFLHRMLTQDVRSMTAGEARPACFLTAQGKVLADLLLSDLGGEFGFTLDVRAAPTAVSALARYVIADDVALADISPSWAHFLLAGPRSPEALTAAGLPVPPNGRFLAATIAGSSGSVLRLDWKDRPVFRVAVPADRVAAARRALLAVPGVSPASEADLDVARIETMTPAWGAEVDERVIPNEAGLSASISWTKGCYLGQEVVVMAKHRGHPATLLCRLAVEGEAVPARGAALLQGDRRAGRVTTAGRGVLLPGVVALGLVRFDLAKAGASLTVEGTGSRAVVSAVAA